MKKETMKTIIIGGIIITLVTLGVIYLLSYLVFNSFKEGFEANNYSEIGNCEKEGGKWNDDLWECIIDNKEEIKEKPKTDLELKQKLIDENQFYKKHKDNSPSLALPESKIDISFIKTDEIKILNKTDFNAINFISYKNEIYHCFRYCIKSEGSSEGFELIEDNGFWFYYKDKDFVYYNGKKIEGSDSKSFEGFLQNSYNLWKDKNGIYLQGLKIKETDLETFESLSNYYMKDKNNVYQKVCKIPQENCTDFTYEILEKADSKTFEVLEYGYRKLYAKDKKNAYFRGKIIEGADVESFEVIEWDGREEYFFYAKDKNNFYRNGEVYEEK